MRKQVGKRILTAIVTILLIMGLTGHAELGNANADFNTESSCLKHHYTLSACLYVTATTDTYVYHSCLKNQTSGEITRRNYIKIPKGTVLGSIKYDAYLYRASKSLWTDICKTGKEDVMAYRDGYALDVTVKPMSNGISVQMYYQNAWETSLHYYNTTTWYCASELLTVEMSIPKRHSVYASSSNPFVLSDGGYIYDWGPKNDDYGSDGYEVSVSAPFSIGYTFKSSTDFCTVSDKTNKDTGVFKTEYDYKKYNSLRFCSADRQKIIFGSTEQECHCLWRDTDPIYKLYPYITYKVTVVNGKSWIGLNCVGSATFTRVVTPPLYMDEATLK